MLGIDIKRGVASTLERVFTNSGNEFDKLEILWGGKTAGISSCSMVPANLDPSGNVCSIVEPFTVLVFAIVYIICSQDRIRTCGHQGIGLCSTPQTIHS